MIKPLTSLRFFFAFMVLLSHCGSIDSYFDRHVFQEGFVGVSFFFVLSGFIIAYNYREKIEHGTISRQKFWVARIARIYPLHIFTVFIALLLHTELWQNGVSWIIHLVPNLFLLQAFIPKNSFYYSFNSPSWSLCCEMLFYTLFPFLVKWFNSIGRLISVVGIMSGIILTGMSYTPEDQAIVNTIWYVNPISRLCDFFIGMLLFALYAKYSKVSLNYKIASMMEVMAVVIFLAFYLFSDSLSIVYRASAYYWIPVSLVVYVFALERGYISRLLSRKYLVYLGEISFGVYMFHFLVIDILVRIMHKIHIAPNGVISFSILIFICLLLSSLSFRYIEKPANHWVKKVWDSIQVSRTNRKT